MTRTATTIANNNYNDKNNEFVTRFFDDCLQELARTEVTFLSNIRIVTYDITLCNNQQGREETALLRYLPYEDGTPYISLVFIPEYVNQNDETRRSLQIDFLPSFFQSFPIDIIKEQPFKSDRSVEQAFMHDAASRDALEIISSGMVVENTFSQQLKICEAAILLLRHSINAFYRPDEANYLPACSFLNHSSEREKILDAQKIIINQLDAPLTIRELSKLVGMNECYLKKGFKAMFGKTIHEYLQYQRIEKAKLLLQQKRMSVNEVALELGFGSASHFSTSFKKIAGMKPCELL